MAGKYYCGLGFRIVEVSRHTTLPRDTDPCAPGEIGTRSPHKRAAADPRLRPRGHRVWHFISYYVTYFSLHIPEYVPHLRHMQFVVSLKSKRVYFTLFYPKK